MHPGPARRPSAAPEDLTCTAVQAIYGLSCGGVACYKRCSASSPAHLRSSSSRRSAQFDIEHSANVFTVALEMVMASSKVGVMPTPREKMKRRQVSGDLMKRLSLGHFESRALANSPPWTENTSCPCRSLPKSAVSKRAEGIVRGQRPRKTPVYDASNIKLVIDKDMMTLVVRMLQVERAPVSRTFEGITLSLES